MKQPTPSDKQMFQSAMQELNHGDPQKAIDLFSSVRNSWCDNADIFYLEGLAYGKLGKTDKVKASVDKALQMQDDHYGAICLLANIQMIDGDTEAAMLNYKRAMQLNPGALEVSDNYGRALSILGKWEEAIVHHKRMLQQHTSYAPAHAALAKAYCEGGDPKSGMGSYKDALAIDPRLYEAHVGIGQIYCGLGGLRQAQDHYQQAIEIFRQGKQGHLGLATVAKFMGEFDKALTYIDSAAQFSEPDDYTLKSLRAEIYERKGDYKKAYEIIESLNDEDRYMSDAVSVFTNICKHIDMCDEAMERIDKCLDNPRTDYSQKQNLLFAAGDLYDRLKRYDEAMSFYQKANSTGNRPACDYKYYESFYDELKHSLSSDNYEKLNRSTNDSTRPIFILGMPRSGTTLTEQILSRHPDVFAAGEQGYIKELSMKIADGRYGQHLTNLSSDDMDELSRFYLSRMRDINDSAKYITDKMPHNFQHVGLISLLFPNASIIHCKRNPVDNGISIYFQNFLWVHDYATDLADIGYFYRKYDELMSHWQDQLKIPMLTVQYEDLIDDQEGMSRKILDYCGLDWDEDVMKFYQSDRDVATASYEQVRQPIYKSSIERWRNYESYLQPLIDELPEHCKPS